MSNVTDNLGLSYGEVKDVDNNHHLTGSTHLDEKHVEDVSVSPNAHEVSVGVEHSHSVTVGQVGPALEDVDSQQVVDTRHGLHPRHETQSTEPSPTQHATEDETNLQAPHGSVHASHAGATTSTVPHMHHLTAPAPEALVSFTSGTEPNSSSSPTARRRGAERYHPTSMQLKTLMTSFEENPCPSVATLNHLSASINMPMHNLVLWFKNKRARSKKNNIRLPGQRRSYVKSGIYSRAGRISASESVSKEEQEAIPQTHPPLAPPQPPPTHADHSHSHNESLPEPQFDTGPRNCALSRPIGTSSPLSAQIRPQAQPPNAKRFRTNSDDTTEGNNTLVQTQNACRNWSSLKCLQVFTMFFSKHTGGRHHDQMKAAQAVASDFFMSEMQSGLTVSSFVQPIKTSMEILDSIINKRTKQGHPPLSSGSRSILGEFIVQIRSGEANTFGDEHSEL